MVPVGLADGALLRRPGPPSAVPELLTAVGEPSAPLTITAPNAERRRQAAGCSLPRHALIRSEGHELIFSRADGRPFSPYTLAARGNRHWDDAGCARITLHECRHTFAALMVSAMSAAGKFNAKVLQTLMGHSSITVTIDRYGHLMPGSEIEAAGLLDRYLEATAAAARGADGTPRGKSAGKFRRCGKVSSALRRTTTRAG
jgi:hypothetical protein